MTTEEIKALLSLPISLFLLMLLGTVVSWLKQIKDARNNGATISVRAYLLSLDTAIGLGVNVLAFISLIMTDSLNWTGALAIGYVINSAVDMRPGGRSAAIIDSIPSKETPK